MDTVTHNSEVEKRMSINENDNFLGNHNFCQGSMNVSGIKRKIGEIVSPTEATNLISPPGSPASHSLVGAIPKMAPTTPVRTAQITAKWLQTVISPLPLEQSAELERFLLLGNINIKDELIRRANIVLGAIFPSSELGHRVLSRSLHDVNLMDSLWSEHRRIEALKLYYKILESICRSETRKLNERNLCSLLTNERFHRCMLTCSAELVSAAHTKVNMLFPVAFQRTGITAFDLIKVIEYFIRHEDSLPRELKRHLNSFEEQLLESMVWEKGSSLYNSLIVARPALSAEINRLGLLAGPMPSLDAISMQNHYSSSCLPYPSFLQNHNSPPGQDVDIRSPKRACLESDNKLVKHNTINDCPPPSSSLEAMPPSPSLLTAFVSPTQPNAHYGRGTCTDTAIGVLFSKMEKLAAVRINSMAERLKLSNQIREKIYCLFQQILTKQTILFFIRHIDQIILCCFFGVAKISQIKLTFNEIIENYMKQPQFKSQVFQCVFVNWPSAHDIQIYGEDQIGIKKFYNKIFILNVKSILDEICSAGASDHVPQLNNNDHCPSTSWMSSLPSIPDLSPKKVSPSQNVYSSPLRPSKKNALNSHVAKSYYAFVGMSTQPYQSPSKELTAINDRLNGTRKLRGKLNFDNVNGRLINDALVVESLFLQNDHRAPLPVSSPQI